MFTLSIKKKLVLAIIFILITASEVTLRFLGFGDPPLANIDPDIEYYLKPNASYNRYGNRIFINRYGMRSKDFNKENDFEKTIFLLGDSVIYGNHFLDQNQTIAHHLSNTIKESTTQPLCAAIAASSWGPDNILAYYKKFGAFKGDIAFIVQSSHDQTDIPYDSSSQVPYRVSPSVTAIFDFALFTREKIQQKLDSEVQISPLTHKEKIAQTNLALTELIQLLKQDFNRVVLVYHATQTELLAKKDINDAPMYFEKVAIKNDIEYLNTLSQYRKHPFPKTLYRDDIHLSAIGTDFVAAMLADLVQ